MAAPPKRPIIDVNGNVVPLSREPGYLNEWLKELKELHARILAERGGVPIEIDDLLGEMRGREHSPAS